MQKYVNGHVSSTMEHHKLYQQTQQQGETFDNYLMSLKELANA